MIIWRQHIKYPRRSAGVNNDTFYSILKILRRHHRFLEFLENNFEIRQNITIDRASLPYGRYAVFGDVSHGTPCCRSSVR